MKKYILIASACFALQTKGVVAQNNKSTAYETEAFGSVSTGANTPFWMSSQTWGLVPLDANNGYLRGYVSHSEQLSQDVKWDLGLDLAASTKHAYNTLWIQQFYGDISWKKWNLRIGPKEYYKSLLNERLSTGDYVLSNNARPIPEMNIGLKDFVPVPLTGNKLLFRGDFAVGKLFDGNYIENIAKPSGTTYMSGIYNHHKSMFLRVGDLNAGNKFRFTLALEHYVLFGGHGFVAGEEMNSKVNLSTFWKSIFVGREKSGEVQYRYAEGSHTGAYTLKLDYQTKNKDLFSIYWHHLIEDGSSAGPQSIRDMLLGLEYKSNAKNLISGAVLEYMYTKNQSGSVHFNITMDEAHQHLVSKGNGMDDYYNNYQYAQGPSYFGRSVGTPLFLSPEYNTDGTINFKSNRIIAFHGAMEGYLKGNLYYRLRATYGETWGRYSIPFLSMRDGLASSLDLRYACPKTKGLELKLTLAMNTGRFFDDNSFGTGISIVKRGVIDWTRR